MTLSLAYLLNNTVHCTIKKFLQNWTDAGRLCLSLFFDKYLKKQLINKCWWNWLLISLFTISSWRRVTLTLFYLLWPLNIRLIDDLSRTQRVFTINLAWMWFHFLCLNAGNVRLYYCFWSEANYRRNSFTLCHHCKRFLTYFCNSNFDILPPYC